MDLSIVNEKLDAARQAVRDLVSEPKKIVLVGCGLLILMAAIAIVTILMGAPKKSSEKVLLEDNKLVLQEDLLIPLAQVYDDSYITSRTTEDFWKTEEIGKHFSPPSNQQLNDLRRVNDHAAKDLVNSAP